MWDVHMVWKDAEFKQPVLRVLHSCDIATRIASLRAVRIASSITCSSTADENSSKVEQSETQKGNGDIEEFLIFSG